MRLLIGSVRYLTARTRVWWKLGVNFQPGALKWNSQEMTKANTRHASSKLRNRWPCQKLCVSDDDDDDDEGGGDAVAASFQCSVGSVSPEPTTFFAIEPQTSHVLQTETKGRTKISMVEVKPASRLETKHESHFAMQQPGNCHASQDSNSLWNQERKHKLSNVSFQQVTNSNNPIIGWFYASQQHSNSLWSQISRSAQSTKEVKSVHLIRETKPFETWVLISFSRFGSQLGEVKPFKSWN